MMNMTFQRIRGTRPFKVVRDIATGYAMPFMWPTIRRKNKDSYDEIYREFEASGHKSYHPTNKTCGLFLGAGVNVMISAGTALNLEASDLDDRSLLFLVAYPIANGVSYLYEKIRGRNRYPLGG